MREMTPFDTLCLHKCDTNMADINRRQAVSHVSENQEFTENEIDGEVLLSLTERSLELLIPIIGHRMKFLNLLTKLEDIADAHQRHE